MTVAGEARRGAVVGGEVSIDDTAAIQARVAKVKAVHQRHAGRDGWQCKRCGLFWPCVPVELADTITALLEECEQLIIERNGLGDSAQKLSADCGKLLERVAALTAERDGLTREYEGYQVQSRYERDALTARVAALEGHLEQLHAALNWFTPSRITERWWAGNSTAFALSASEYLKLKDALRATAPKDGAS